MVFEDKKHLGSVITGQARPSRITIQKIAHPDKEAEMLLTEEQR